MRLPIAAVTYDIAKIYNFCLRVILIGRNMSFIGDISAADHGDSYFVQILSPHCVFCVDIDLAILL